MITPASSSVSAAPVASPGRPVSGPPDPAAGQDTFLTGSAAQLQAALARTPAVRPEVVARAGALAVDPAYPSLEIINQVARLIANSQDPSETLE